MNNIDSIDRWLQQSHILLGTNRLLTSRYYEEIVDVQEALNNLKGSIPPIQYQQVNDQLISLKDRVRRQALDDNEYAIYETAYNSMRYIFLLFSRMF